MNSAIDGILCEIYNADKTNLRTAFVRSLEEIKSIGRDAFHYPANIQIKVLLAVNGVEIKTDAMLKDFSASMPEILKIQLLTSEDSETGAGTENLNSGTTNSGAEGGNNTSSDAHKAAAAAATGAAGAVLGAPAVISAIGFTTNGVAAGSMAAGIQAGIGNVAAGSLFATMQSVGAVGLGATGIGAVALGGAALGFGAYKLGKYVYDKTQTDEKKEKLDKY